MGRKRRPRAGTNSAANNKSTRYDGYANLLNKYGTPMDNSTAYRFQPPGFIPDIVLTEHYEGGGLFSKIIDAPAEEALKHGFELAADQPEAEQLLNDALDTLEWGEKAATAIKWARLYGGAIIVMLIDDGGGIDEPLNRGAIRGIDGIKVYERSVVQPDWTTALYGEPRYYEVSGIGGFFKAHASRCLVFKNGVLPENTMNAQYRHWGLPEYARIKNELRECVTSHGLSVKLLDRSVQAIYSMKGLANILSTLDGEDKVLRRLQLIDKARGILNSIAIDSEGESYDFKSIPFSGVKDIIDATCNMLSAVTNIPQTILFGRSPAGMNATGQGDLENYYNLCERIQKMMLYGNLKTLAGVILNAAHTNGKLAERLTAKIKFKPLWSLSETEQAAVEQARAAASLTKAQTAQIYVDMGALDPSEVRRGLAENKEFDIEKLLDDTAETDLLAGWEEPESEKQGITRRNGQEYLIPNAEDDIIENNVMLDGGAGSGRYPKGSGDDISPETAKSYNNRLVGLKASCGIVINSISKHAMKRFVERGVSENQAADLLENATILYPGNVSGTQCQQKGNLRIVINEKTGNVISVIDLGKGE